jgi:CheY-like chemotaxis protein
MDADRLDVPRVEQGFLNLYTQLRQGAPEGPLWIYGEAVDVLCRDGKHGEALRLEQLWNQVFAGRGVHVMCAYSLDGFDDDSGADHLRKICRQHTHVVPAEAVVPPSDDRTVCEQVVLFQHRARVLGGLQAAGPAPGRAARTGAATSIVHVIDDDMGVRRSLARLLAAAGFRVATFASAEAFLENADASTIGCLILDVQLLGMSGIDLQNRMAEEHWPMPVIAMSASLDDRIEQDALRLGAGAFLRKPFDSEALFDALARVCRS